MRNIEGWWSGRRCKKRYGQNSKAHPGARFVASLVVCYVVLNERTELLLLVERLASDPVQFGSLTHPVAVAASSLAASRRRRASLAEKVLSKRFLGLAHYGFGFHSQCVSLGYWGDAFPFLATACAAAWHPMGTSCSCRTFGHCLQSSAPCGMANVLVIFVCLLVMLCMTSR